MQIVFRDRGEAAMLRAAMKEVLKNVCPDQYASNENMEVMVTGGKVMRVWDGVITEGKYNVNMSGCDRGRGRDVMVT